MLRSMRGKWLLWVRRCHLYLSVFFAPLLLLFVITGWWQTVVPRTKKPYGYQPWLIEKLSDIHKSQYYPGFGKTSLSSFSFEVLVVAMCIALTISISLGLVLAFTTVRNRIPVLIALMLGIATPVLLLALACLKH